MNEINFDEMLEGMQDIYEAGKDSKPGLPDGTYQMQLQEANMAVSAKGNLMVKLTHLVLEGEYEGTKVRSNLLCMTEENFYYLSQWVEQMGFIPPRKIKDIPEIVKEISEANPVYTAAAKQSGDFTNVYIRELISGAEVKKTKPAPEPEPKTEPEDITPENIEPDELPDGFIIGAEVTFDYEEETTAAKIVSISGPEAIDVEDNEGEIFSVGVEDLTLVEEEKPKPKTKKKTGKKKTKKDSDDSVRLELFALMSAHDVAEGLTDKSDLADLVARLNEYDWEESELIADEIKLLKSVKIKIVK